MTLSLDDEVVIERGGTGTLSATLMSEGAGVAGVEATIRLASGLAPVLRDDGTPECAPGLATGKLVFASTRHEGGSHCTRRYDCNVLRILVLSLTDTGPIPDGPVFSCAIAVDPQVTIFLLPLGVASALASDPAGGPLAVAAVDGLVRVPMPPSATPSDTRTPTATWTPDAHPTTTGDPGGIRSRLPTSRPPSDTPALPPTTSPTATPSFDGGGGCAVGPKAEGSLGPMLVVLALALARRRRPRRRADHPSVMRASRTTAPAPGRRRATGSRSRE